MRNKQIRNIENEIFLKNISALIRKNIENLEEPLVILKADASLKHGFIIKVLDELRKIEKLKISISTIKK